MLMTSLTVALAVPAPARVASAQAHEHRGFWIGFGFGGGVNFTQGLDGERLAGGSGYLRLGGTPSQRLLLGFEGIGWGRHYQGAALGRGNGAFVAMYYPSIKGGGFLKAGVGTATISRATSSGSTTSTTSEPGFGLTLGTGWDLRMGKNFYATPNFDVLLQWFEGKDDPVLGEIPGTNTILLFTFGLTWH
jgi:hypothetical protein